MGLSFEAKQNYVAFTTCATGSLSFLGSALTLLTILRARFQQAKWTTYHRLLLGMSLTDLCLSLGFALGPLPVPLTRMPFPGTGHGTVGTCSFQGFLLQLGLASYSYSAMLILFYVLVVCFGLPDTMIAKRFEPWMHSVVLLFHGVVAVVGFALKMYNPVPGGICWVAGSPPMCETKPPPNVPEFASMPPLDQEPPMPPLGQAPSVMTPLAAEAAMPLPTGGMQCQRGSGHQEFQKLTSYPTIIVTVFLLAALVMIVVAVWRKVRASRRFKFDKKAKTSSHEQKMLQVIHQCFLYGITFLNCIVWKSVLTVTMHALPPGEFQPMGKHFWMLAMNLFFFPLQGFFNFLIYIRPRYTAIRCKFTAQGRWFALKEAIWYPEAKPSERTSRLSVLSSSPRKGATTENHTTTGVQDATKNIVPTDVEQNILREEAPSMKSGLTFDGSSTNIDLALDDSSKNVHPLEVSSNEHGAPARRGEEDSSGVFASMRGALQETRDHSVYLMEESIKSHGTDSGFRASMRGALDESRNHSQYLMEESIKSHGTDRGCRASTARPKEQKDSRREQQRRSSDVDC